MATASATSSTSTARSGGDGNELLDLQGSETSEQDSAQAEHSSGSDPAPTANEPTQGAGGDGLSEALKAERRRSNNLEKELRGLRQQLTRFSEINPEEWRYDSDVILPLGGRDTAALGGSMPEAHRGMMQFLHRNRWVICRFCLMAFVIRLITG